MAFIPLFRTIIFTLVTLLSFVVLGICTHIEYLAAGYTDIYLSFAPFGLAASCLTIISLPVFLILGNRRQRVFTSMILFEIIWFFVLWLVWVGTAGDTVAGKAYNFPAGCVYDDYPEANQICYEFTVVEAVAFFNFFCAFIYYDVIFMYAIINAIRGRSIWVASVKEAASVVPGAVNPAPMVQPQFGPAPAAQYQTYGAYPSGVPPPQPYNVYPPQVPAPVSYAPPYNMYAQQVPPQGPIPQQYGAYPPQGVPTTQPDQNQQYNHPAPVAPQQWASYGGYVSSPPAKDASLPPQPDYSAHPVHASQGQLPLPTGYQPVVPQPSAALPSPYDHPAPPV